MIYFFNRNLKYLNTSKLKKLAGRKIANRKRFRKIASKNIKRKWLKDDSQTRKIIENNFKIIIDKPIFNRKRNWSYVGS